MSFHLTGNEYDRSYTYTIKIDETCSFSKIITVNTDPDYDNYKYDIYEERFNFPTYYFIVGKHIDKIQKEDKEITEEFVKNYTYRLENEDYCIRWIYKKEILIPVNPYINLKLYSEQLYDKYCKYYERIVNEKLSCFYYFLK